MVCSLHVPDAGIISRIHHKSSTPLRVSEANFNFFKSSGYVYSNSVENMIQHITPDDGRLWFYLKMGTVSE